MKRQVFVLTGWMVGGWLAIEMISQIIGWDNRRVTLLAVLSIWWPNVWSMLLVDRTRKTAPIIQIGVLMGGSFVRMIFSVVTGGLGWYLISEVQERTLELLIWGAVFYVVGLVVTTTLIYHMVSVTVSQEEGLSA